MIDEDQLHSDEDAVEEDALLGADWLISTRKGTQ